MRQPASDVKQIVNLREYRTKSYNMYKEYDDYQYGKQTGKKYHTAYEKDKGTTDAARISGGRHPYF